MDQYAKKTIRCSAAWRERVAPRGLDTGLNIVETRFRAGGALLICTGGHLDAFYGVQQTQQGRKSPYAAPCRFGGRPGPAPRQIFGRRTTQIYKNESFSVKKDATTSLLGVPEVPWGPDGQRTYSS